MQIQNEMPSASVQYMKDWSGKNIGIDLAYSLMFVFLTLIRYYGQLTLWTIFLRNGGIHINKT